MTDVWRLLVNQPQDGYSNMAIDEAIMGAHARGTAKPTIRFFRWNPPCVSLGYFQSARSEIDLEACRKLGVDFVRRPTGGRAILHDAELTYSVVAHTDEAAVRGSILESYRKISQALLLGLAQLGVDAEMKPLAVSKMPGSGAEDGTTPVVTAACFDVPSDYEIAVGGRKLIGSAQTRRDDVVLQHGSLLFEVDTVKIFTVLKPPPGADSAQVAKWLATRVTSLNELLGRVVSFEEVADKLRHGFSEAFGITLEPGELSDEELSLVEQLRKYKYASSEWNLKR